MLPQSKNARETVARPLRVLVPLIHDDLKQGREAAARAALPFYQAAGEKLLEAKAQLKHGEFLPWVRRNFPVSVRQCRNYMNLAAAEKGTAVPFLSLKDFIRQTSSTPKPDRTFEAVKAAFGTEEQKLAVRLITTGYKALARELHPDTGGSKDDMTRLNDVRDHLKRANTAEVVGNIVEATAMTGVKHKYFELAKVLSNFDHLSAGEQQTVLKTLEQTLTELRARARLT